MYKIRIHFYYRFETEYVRFRIDGNFCLFRVFFFFKYYYKYHHCPLHVEPCIYGEVINNVGDNGNRMKTNYPIDAQPLTVRRNKIEKDKQVVFGECEFYSLFKSDYFPRIEKSSV